MLTIKTLRSECPVYAGTQVSMIQRTVIHTTGMQGNGRSAVGRCV